MQTNYVLVDFENVRPDSLDDLDHDQFKLVVFVGASQSKLPFDLAEAVQRRGTRAEYVKISGNGPNALDFHIAYYIGKFSAADPSSLFYIVSKDAGFDPLIQHLKSKQIFVRRVKSVAEIHLVEPSGVRSPAERQKVVLDRLKQMKASKPRTVRTLSGTIASLFPGQISDEEVADLIDSLKKRGCLTVHGTKVSYEAACDG
jgi:hypothetical protein